MERGEARKRRTLRSVVVFDEASEAVRSSSKMQVFDSLAYDDKVTGLISFEQSLERQYVATASSENKSRAVGEAVHYVLD